MKCPTYRRAGGLRPSFTLRPPDPARAHETSSCGTQGPPVGQAAATPRRDGGRGRSYLLLAVLGQQQADLGQLLADHLLVDHVQLQAGLGVLGQGPLLRVVLVVAGVSPPLVLLVARARHR